MEPLNDAPSVKEDVMKNSTFITAALLAVAVTAPAQSTADRPFFPPSARYQKADIRSLERSYVFALGSTNDGVVESAIAHVARIKLEVPSASMERVKAALGCLSVNGKTAGIRYRAYLAGLVFDDPKLFAQDAAKEFATSEEFFTALSGRLQTELLTAVNKTYVRPE
jgi:hypothetical protein